MKKFLIILLLLIAIPSLLVHFYFDNFLKQKLKVALDQVPNATITIGTVSTSFLPPSISINNINIKNGENDVWREINIQRIRVNPNLFETDAQRIVIESATIVNPVILCDLTKLDITKIAQQITTDTSKTGKAGIGGILQGITQIVKGTTGLGTSIVKTIINPKTIITGTNDKKITISTPKTKNSLNFVIRNVYIKQAIFVPMQDILTIKAGNKISLPDINFTNINQNSKDKVLDNIKQVVTESVKEALVNLKNKK